MKNLSEKRQMVWEKAQCFFNDAPKRFAVLALIWGILFSFLIIPWQTPDEYAHLNMIGQGIGNENLANVLLQEIPLDRDRIMFHEDEEVDRAKIAAAQFQKPTYNRMECMPKGINLGILKHLPSTLGVFVGILFHLPVYWVLHLGELFSLLFYVGIGYKALKLLPCKKWVLEVVMLLPMCIQQAASMSYDAVLLPLCFLFVAYVLHLKYSSPVVGTKQILILGALVGVIFIIKLPYAVLGVLIFMIPINKFELQIYKWKITGDMLWKFRVAWWSALVILMLIAMYIMRSNAHFQILLASIQDLSRTAYLFTQSINNFGESLLVSAVGNFGYLDTPMPLWFVGVITAYMVVMSMTKVWKTSENVPENKGWNRKDIIILAVCGLIGTYMVVLSMVKHTYMVTTYGTEDVAAVINYQEILHQIPYIGGLQGRYFIPFLLVALLGLPQMFEMKYKKYIKSSWGVLIFSLLYTCCMIYQRYW